MPKIQIGTILFEDEKTTEIYNQYKNYFCVEVEYEWLKKYVICKEPSVELVSAVENYYAYVKEQNRKRDEFIDFVAQDVVGQLSEADKEYIYAHPSSADHHFGMGLGIRNKYIHGQKLDFEVGHPDNLSSAITSRISSLLISDYDYENPFYRNMYDDFAFDHVRRLYYVQEGKYPDEILASYAGEPDDYKAAEECKDKIKKIVVNSTRFKKKALKAGLSDLQFEEFKSFVDEYNKKNWDIIPYDVAILASKSLEARERAKLLRLLETVLKESPRLASEMPVFVLNQKDTVLIAVTEFGKALQRLPRFNKDDEVIRAALMDNGEAIQYVHKDLRYKREYLELALSSEYGATLKMRCMAKYRDDDELVKIALSANGRNIEYASARIRDDIEMAKYAITHQKSYYPESTVCNLSRRLRDNLEIALLDIKEGHGCVDDYSARLRDSEAVAEALNVSEHKWKMYMMSKRIQKLYANSDD